eukprot:TRINITY_DN57637_c0_g1_i1.p1 TRINITY_DN57637_c0_g1~~TRINITY_DN57637_c0_g1_i1.p1  ORF type:complete len:344 (-),score=50.26 TRINITY_DN57637_c0_g1_i1:4-1035(-)
MQKRHRAAPSDARLRPPMLPSLAGRALRRPSRVMGVIATSCLLALATRRAGLGFVAWMGRETQQQPVAEAASRRGVLAGAVMGLLPALGWSAAQAPANAQTMGLDDPCRCCDKDWCVTTCTEKSNGENTSCDCQLYLTEKRGILSRDRAGDKLKIPLDHESARQKSVASGTGEEGWASQLKWKDAAMMRWVRMENPRFETGNSTLGDGSLGLFTARGLAKYTVLPPYLGRPLSVDDLLRMRGTPAMEYVFCPLQERPLLSLSDGGLKQIAAAKPTTTFCVDGASVLERNPARYIRAARNKEECKRVNVQLCEFGNVGYFRTTKAVEGGQELIADFGTEDFEGC